MALISTGARSPRPALTRYVAAVKESNVSGAPESYDLVVAPGEGRRIVVTGYFLASNSSAVISVLSDADVKLEGYLYTTYPLTSQDERGLIELDANEKLAITLSANATVRGWISYIIEDA